MVSGIKFEETAECGESPATFERLASKTDGFVDAEVAVEDADATGGVCDDHGLLGLGSASLEDIVEDSLRLGDGLSAIYILGIDVIEP